MPPTAEPSARALLDAVATLPLVVETATCRVADVSLAAYPGGLRPSAVVTLAGGGEEGAGEHVAWTAADHGRLRDALPTLVPRGSWRFGDWAAEVARRSAKPYECAALEAAALDLALRQGGTNLFRLANVRPRPVRYVVSFERRPDPAAEARRLCAVTPGLEFKIDADPAWNDAVYEALAALGTVAVLDFKGAGTVADHERAYRALPDALIEDPRPDAAPWSQGLQRRISVDAPVLAATDVAALPVRPAAVNVKPARMGGVLEALRAVAVCADAGIPVYLGGMFEVDVGRRQLHALAALFAPGGPNDVAPLAPKGSLRPQITVDASSAGFA